VFIARSVANFSSNRLGHLSKILHLKQKKQEKGDGWPSWWIKAMAGDMKALHDMAAYCRQDVEATEELYLRLLPFDRAHTRVYQDRTLCGACGGAVQYRGYLWASGRRYQRYQCCACGRWGQGGTA